MTTTTPEPFWPPLPDPVPTVIRPLRHETLGSYIDRLIETNHAGRSATWDKLGRDELDNVALRLAALSVVPLDHLFYAIRELTRATRPTLGTWPASRSPTPTRPSTPSAHLAAAAPPPTEPTQNT